MTILLDVHKLQHSCLKPLSFSLKHGELVVLLGASGCGKTTLLKRLAGLLPGDGEIWLQGQALQHLPTHQRPLAYLSQDLHLFPHLTVYRNLWLALCFSGYRGAFRPRIEQILTLTRIQHRADRKPRNLSGGERQRAALARALVGQPLLLLLDEPFCRLDPANRQALWADFRALQQQQQLTTLLVTHDLQEAEFLADRILTLDEVIHENPE